MIAAPQTRTRWQPVGLGAPPAPGDYAMLWTPAAQMMSDGQAGFTHDGAINTEPSHDLTHLIIAANGSLDWKPAGPRPSICRAEYNAVMLENLYDRIYRASHTRERELSMIVPEVITHGHWFVTAHFAPFPATSPDAWGAFCRGIDPELCARLSPYFYAMKHAEETDSTHMDKTWTSRFRATDNPRGWENLRAETHKLLRSVK